MMAPENESRDAADDGGDLHPSGFGHDSSDVLEYADWPSKRGPLKRKVVRKRLYIIIFFLILAFLSIGSVQVYHQREEAFLSVKRWYPTPVFYNLSDRLPLDDTERARQLGLELSEMYKYENAVNQLVATEDRVLGPLDWGINLSLGEYTVIVNYRIFVNMAISALIAWALYIRARDRAASSVIDDQNKRLRELNVELERKVRESERYLKELQQAQSKLVQAQKLASIGRLSATLAHEIRNPLSIMMSAAGIAAEDVPAGSPPSEAIELIRQEIARLDQIITELLNFARPKPPRLDTQNLTDLVQAWALPLSEELEKGGVHLELDINGTDLPVQADADQLYQVFLNLVWNARDAVQENGGGSIRVSIEDQGEEGIALSIRDDGPGMDKEMLQQIHEPFFTTKTSGSGLGLPVVQQLMEGMGGSVHIESELERGTTVHLHLRPAPT